MTGQSDLRAAVIGVGHLGRSHARVYSEMAGVALCHLIDADPARAAEAAETWGGEGGSDHRDILGKVDIVSIVTPTAAHHEIARDFLDAGVSVLVEKPMTATVAQADDLIRLAKERGAKLQVGHIERFNPAYLAISNYLRNPAFIECHRLSPYSFRSTDVSVVLDLMIHDLDLILDMAGAPAASVEAAGVAILSPNTDIANVRLRFNTPEGRPGCVANVTASRISPKPMRRLRVFQPDAYISMDFLEKKAYVFRKKDGFDAAKTTPEQLAAPADVPKEPALGRLLDVRTIDLGPTDALEQELAAFVESVRNDTEPAVTGEHGRRALALAVAIDEDIRQFLQDRNA